MESIQDKTLKKQTSEQMYVEMDISVQEIAKVIGVSDKTIYKWIKKEKWNEKKTETQNLERQISINLRRALNQGLRSFANDPNNKDLQSLVSLLKQYKEQNKPTMAFKDNIIKFIDRTTDFFLEKNLEEFANTFKGYVVELAEYLLLRR